MIRIEGKSDVSIHEYPISKAVQHAHEEPENVAGDREKITFQGLPGELRNTIYQFLDASSLKNVRLVDRQRAQEVAPYLKCNPPTLLHLKIILDGQIGIQHLDVSRVKQIDSESIEKISSMHSLETVLFDEKNIRDASFFYSCIVPPTSNSIVQRELLHNWPFLDDAHLTKSKDALLNIFPQELQAELHRRSALFQRIHATDKSFKELQTLLLSPQTTQEEFGEIVDYPKLSNESQRKQLFSSALSSASTQKQEQALIAIGQKRRPTETPAEVERSSLYFLALRIASSEVQERVSQILGREFDVLPANVVASEIKAAKCLYHIAEKTYAEQLHRLISNQENAPELRAIAEQSRDAMREVYSNTNYADERVENLRNKSLLGWKKVSGGSDAEASKLCELNKECYFAEIQLKIHFLEKTLNAKRIELSRQTPAMVQRGARVALLEKEYILADFRHRIVYEQFRNHESHFINGNQQHAEDGKAACHALWHNVFWNAHIRSEQDMLTNLYASVARWDFIPSKEERRTVLTSWKAVFKAHTMKEIAQIERDVARQNLRFSDMPEDQAMPAFQESVRERIRMVWQLEQSREILPCIDAIPVG